MGIAAGYISRFLNEKIKLPKNFAAMKPMFLVPGISVFAIFLLNMYLIDPVFGQLNLMMANGIKSMSGTGQLTLSAVIAAATAFDLGGPVNKAAGAIAIGLASDQVFPLTPRVLAIVIPPIGLGLATMLDRFVVKRRVFPADLRVVGGTSFFAGISGNFRRSPSLHAQESADHDSHQHDRGYRRFLYCSCFRSCAVASPPRDLGLAAGGKFCSLFYRTCSGCFIYCLSKYIYPVLAYQKRREKNKVYKKRIIN
uniref:hypothetical protein n=1 Tax=Clostridium sp. NkU-1 TaxID=1095009 RepID=UPI000ACA6BEF